MAPIEILLVVLFATGVLLAVLASWQVVKEHEHAGRTAEQLGIVWLLPFIGPLMTLYLLRSESERGAADGYGASHEGWEDAARVDQQDATFNSGGENADH